MQYFTHLHLANFCSKIAASGQFSENVAPRSSRFCPARGFLLILQMRNDSKREISFQMVIFLVFCIISSFYAFSASKIVPSQGLNPKLGENLQPSAELLHEFTALWLRGRGSGVGSFWKNNSTLLFHHFKRPLTHVSDPLIPTLPYVAIKL